MIRREIFLPAGMRDSWVGMPAEQFDGEILRPSA